MSVGRKREFDRQQSLEAAMIVFWKNGYAGTSLSDLTEAMGINKSSLYASFGNKEELFIQATDFYITEIATAHSNHLWDKQYPFEERLRRYLRSVMSKQREKNYPKGCYISLSSSESEGDYIPTNALAKVHAAQQYGLDELIQFFKEGTESVSPELNKSSEANAHFVLAIMNGAATMARGGCCEVNLDDLINKTLLGLGITA